MSKRPWKQNLAGGNPGDENEFYRLLYQNSSDAILLTMPDGQILSANPAACSMFGISEEELCHLGRNSVVDVSDPRLAEGLKIRESTGRFQGELTGLRKDGTKFPMEISSVVFVGRDGKLRTSMVIRDTSEQKRLEAQLQEGGERLSKLAKNLPDAVYILDLERHECTFFNHDSFLGYSREELMAPDSILSQQHPDDTSAVHLHWEKIMQGEDTGDIEYRVFNKAGQWDWVVCRDVTMSHDTTGKPKEIMVILTVITERKRAEEQIQYQFKLLENVNDAIICTDENFLITYWNRAAERIFGWKLEEVIGCSSTEVLQTEFSPEQRAESIHMLNDRGYWKGEIIQHSRSGEPLIFEANIISTRDSQGRIIYVAANREITKRKRAEEELHRAKEALEAINHELQESLKREQILARTDSLTGIFNSRHFFDLAKRAFITAKRYHQIISIIIFDLDHFKQVNDTFGHQAGNEVLRGVAQVAQMNLRETDILARYGGEEFIALLPNSDAQAAKAVAERIRADVAAYHLDIGDEKIGVTISLGIAEFTSATDTIDHLIQHADHALYAAKKQGRNRTVIYSS